jgi:hypothetical protein
MAFMGVDEKKLVDRLTGGRPAAEILAEAAWQLVAGKVLCVRGNIGEVNVSLAISLERAGQ